MAVVAIMVRVLHGQQQCYFDEQHCKFDEHCIRLCLLAHRLHFTAVLQATRETATFACTCVDNASFASTRSEQVSYAGSGVESALASEPALLVQNAAEPLIAAFAVECCGETGNHNHLEAKEYRIVPVNQHKGSISTHKLGLSFFLRNPRPS